MQILVPTKKLHYEKAVPTVTYLFPFYKYFRANKLRFISLRITANKNKQYACCTLSKIWEV